jgi:amino acid adenylation domain-containing protein
MEFSYGEVNRRANQLGWYLAELGVRPEVVVALYLERSIDMVVALFAAWKAGGAYLPLDTTLPHERIAYMIADSKARVIVTTSTLAKNVTGPGVEVICLDAAWERISQLPETNLQNAVDPDNLAYLIYTSGSTGRPKGVGVTHRGLKNYVDWAIRMYQINQKSSSPVHTSFAVDLTVTSIYPILCSGGSISLLADAGYNNLLGEKGGSADYSLLKMTPSHLQILNGLRENKNLISRRDCKMVLGGENLKYSDVQKWRELPGITIINEYGPTETVVGSTVFEVGEEEAGTTVPIGKPISNTEVYVLDDYGQPVPPGVVGELYIGGAGVARGYLGRSALTAERFVPHPFSGNGARLYRTGDKARWCLEGNLEFLGRADEQIKVRGYRIEPAEIETALHQHPDIIEVRVAVLPDASGLNRLTAYFTARRSVIGKELRIFLQRILPEYMLPAAYVMVDRIPVKANGKLDLEALAALGQNQVAAGDSEAVSSEADAPAPALQFPQNTAEAIETRMAEIWKELLHNEIGFEDNFFEAGGHSLLALQLRDKLKEFWPQLTLTDIFAYPTIRSLAGYLTGQNLVQGGGQRARERGRTRRERKSRLRADGPPEAQTG